MAKADPLSPLSAYFKRYVMNGMGLFVEGYVLFSIGNLSSLFSSAWPSCWKTHAVCNEQLINSVTYLEIVGIIFGQILVGIEGDWIGRKFGLVQDAVVMLVGVILLTAVWGATLQGWVAAYVISLFIYSVGVGGEYPMTSTRALETGVNGPAGTRDDRMHRGRNVVLAFLMQGWGQVFNQGVLMLLLVIFNHGYAGYVPGTKVYSEKTAQLTFRVSFGLIAILHAWLAYHRFYHIHDANAVVQANKKRLNTSGYDVASLKLVFGHYWHRLAATAGGWFCADFFFYGSKIFSGVFISIIKPGATLMVTWEYNLLNCAVSLVGYYLAASLVDHKFYGRKTMQLVGFFFMFLFFLFCAIFFEDLQKPGGPVSAFIWMYMMSSFFTQFGPNCTTFLVAAEVYPSSIRSTAHGFSAATGKLGALVPTIVYNYVKAGRTKFWIVPWFGLVAFIMTFLWLPDTTGLDLREQERYWRYVVAGNEDQYHGIAVHPRHLSWWEVHVLKRNRHYNPELDRQAKIEDLRVLYESYMIAQNDESGESDDVEHHHITPDVAAYFSSENIEQKKTAQQLKEEALRRQAPEVRMQSRLEQSGL